MRIFAAPLIIFSPQVNLTTAVTVSPLQDSATYKSVKSPSQSLSRLAVSRGSGVSAVHQERSARELLEINQRFYDALWSGARLVEARRFNTWPLVASLLPQAPWRLEIAPGLRPRLPIEGTQFIDISTPALSLLRQRGGQVVCGSITDLPYADQVFDLVCALDIIEHVDDDAPAWRELARVIKPGALLLVSVPLHPSRWTPFDDFVGHRRRYAPEELRARLRRAWFHRRAQRRIWHAAALLAPARAWECGGSRTIATVRCGGTTPSSCRSACSFSASS
jgi:SAM-dependent methyltransferase